MADVTVGVVAKRETTRAQDLAVTLATTLAADDVAVRVDELTAESVDAAVEGVPVGKMEAFDLVVSIGGDGTFLFVVREVGSVPIVGVNLGEVGFLTALSPDTAVETVRSLVDRLRTTGDLDTRTVPRLRARSDADEWRLDPAFNEVVVQGPRRGPAGGVDVSVAVDGNRYVSTHADGVLVATAAGSTAYNLSEGGPIVAPTVEAIVVTVQCAVDPMPPLVVTPDSAVTVSIEGEEAGFVVADGRTDRPLDPSAVVSIDLAEEPARIAGPRVDFFRALDKLD